MQGRAEPRPALLSAPSTRSDHPIFTRLTRQQLLVRRRHIGFQALILDPPAEASTTASPRSRAEFCSYCQRSFNTIWKPYLCHVCGHWVCEPCSRVMERERVELVIRFIRCCEKCLPLLNTWAVNVEELTAFTFSPWVIQSSVSPLGVNLAEMLRSRPERRHAVLSLLRHLGKELDSLAGVLLDDISENEWAATVSSSHQQDTASAQRSDSRLIRGAQYFVQQCLDVRIPEVPLEKCVLAEMDGRRCYPLTYPSSSEVPLVPNHPMESAREEWLVRYNLHKEDAPPVSEEVALICDLVAKEMESAIGCTTVVMGERQWFLPAMRSEDGGVLVNEGKESFSAHSLLTRNLPLLVRNAQLDVRFRNYKVVTAKSSSLQFFFGVPVLAGDGVVVATLCALDTRPRKSITTTQFSVVKALADVVGTVWKEALDVKASDCPDLAPTNQTLRHLVVSAPH